jgi:Uma2 family endonuclease
MSEAIASAEVPLDVFLDTDYGSRAELVNGVVYLMTGAGPRHNKVTVNAIGALLGSARALGCELFANDMAIKISEKTVYFPDVAVACNTADETARTRTNPCLIIEVLSPSTASIDQREKRIAYEQMTSMRDYLIVDSDARTVEHNRRVVDDRWSRATAQIGDVITDTCLGTLTVADLFIGL